MTEVIAQRSLCSEAQLGGPLFIMKTIFDANNVMGHNRKHRTHLKCYFYIYIANVYLHKDYISVC